MLSKVLALMTEGMVGLQTCIHNVGTLRGMNDKFSFGYINLELPVTHVGEIL